MQSIQPTDAKINEELSDIKTTNTDETTSNGIEPTDTKISEESTDIKATNTDETTSNGIEPTDTKISEESTDIKATNMDETTSNGIEPTDTKISEESTDIKATNTDETTSNGIEPTDTKISEESTDIKATNTDETTSNGIEPTDTKDSEESTDIKATNTDETTSNGIEPTDAKISVEATQPSEEANSQSQILQVASETAKKLVKLILSPDQSKTPLQHRVLSVTNAGGYPEIQEVLPLFLRQTALNIYVQNLSAALSEKPVVQYYDQQGSLLSNPVESPSTNEDHVKYTVRSMQSLKCSATVTDVKTPKILFVGTHEDLEKHDSRSEREDAMKALLLRAFEDDIIFSDKYMKKILFCINASARDANEEKTAQYIRSIINQLYPSVGQKIPLRWFALLIKLQEISKKLNRLVVTKKECLDASPALHLHEKLDSALQYLDELNIIFHYTQILPDVVFCDVQVLLDKITELVEHMYKLTNHDVGEDGICTGEWKKFRDFGLITEAILEAFPSHYVPGIFTVNDLLKLFRTLLVFADFQTDNKEKPEYFLPCLLHRIESEKVDQYIADCKSHVSPLVLHFPHGLLNGVFCFTIATLLSAENKSPAPWRLSLHSDGNPRCLYRNVVQFTVPSFSGVVILIDKFEFIKIIVAGSPPLTTTLCPLVKKAALQALKKAAEVLNYVGCKAVPSILCPCASGSPHPAKTSNKDSMGQQWWMCTRNELTYGKLDDSDKIWNDQEVADEVADGKKSFHDKHLNQIACVQLVHVYCTWINCTMS